MTHLNTPISKPACNQLISMRSSTNSVLSAIPIELIRIHVNIRPQFRRLSWRGVFENFSDNMDECCGQLCGICLGAICGILCLSCCEALCSSAQQERQQRNRGRNVQFVDMYPQMRQPSVSHNRSNRTGLTNQDDDVWNISSRVNQSQDSASNWPTHDHRLSVHDFVMTPDYNIKDTRPPPPPYSEVDLPSYEQATGCRPARPDLTPVHQTAENRPGPSS